METNNIQQLFNDTVNNTKKRFMDPDLIYVMDKEYWYYNKYKNFVAKPFIYSKTLFDEPFMLIGTKYTKHEETCNGQTMDIILKNLNAVTNNNDLVLRICKEIKKYCPNDDLNKAIRRMRVEMSNYDRAILFKEIFPRTTRNGKIPQTTFIFGKYFIVNIEELNKKCLFIATWENTTQEDINFILTQILNKEGNIFTDIYKINASGPMINLKDNTQQQEQGEELSQEEQQILQDKYNIHLMNQDEKRDALDDFRKTRDEKNAKKLGNMTQAQYNALRYVDENKEENKTKRKFIFTEAQIKHIIKENMNNELANYPQSFNMDTFKSLNSYNKKIKYCNDNLQRIASGSSRIVYKIDDATVLKLAKNQKGLAQNEAETQYRDDLYAPDIFAEVYDNDENFYWIEMQLARKAKPTDFKRLTGYDFKTFQNFVTYSAQQYLPRRSYGFSIPSEYEQLFNSEEFQNMVWDNPDNVFYQTNEYLTSYQIEKYGDVQRISSWGVVKDKHDGTDKLVLIDYGLTDDIFNQYYSR